MSEITYKAGMRVYVSMVNADLHEKRHYGTVRNDEISGHDYIVVKLDCNPIEDVIPSWYLHVPSGDDDRTGLVIFDADYNVLKEDTCT